MKYIFLICLLFTCQLFANEQDKSGIGIGGIISESKYKGIDKETTVIPLIKYNANNFYIKGIEFGYKEIDTESFKLNYILAPKLSHYDSGDSPYLEGMDDREMTVEAGVSLVYKLPLISLGTKIKFDTLGVHKGYDIGFRIGSFLPLSKIFFISPSYSKVYLSSNLANYYYGVKSSEETSTREAYNVGKTTMNIYGITFIYKLTKDINTNLTITQTKLSDDIKDSPIIKDKDFNTLIMGVSYTF